MQALLEPPFNLQLGDLVVAVVEAENEVDFSVPSPEYTTGGAVARTKPETPTRKPLRGAATDTT